MSSTGQIVGTVVGSIIGYFVPVVGIPLGAAIGGAIGGYLDPPKTQDNRPTPDLTIQTSTYGAQIGSGDGNYATYGNVFWLENNLLKFSEGSSGGKGGSSEPNPDEVFGTFAIGFGEGEIAAFGRIWCNGNLVYDPTAGTFGAKMANGDVAGNLSFYLGSATQLPDDRIQADMGVANAPGYRGLHYIVFKDWPLADYGNTLMGMQVKAEILNSVTSDQYTQIIYDDTVLPDTNTFPGAGSTEYGYFNPRFENGIFYCEKSSIANNYEYTFAVSPDGTLLAQYQGSTITGVFGYIGSIEAGIVAYSGSVTGTFTVGGSQFKLKTSDPDNTCHGMSVGPDGRIYALERVSAAWKFNIYDGTSLALVSSGTNNSIQLGNNDISIPCIPGTNVTFCVEADGTNLWNCAEGGGNSYTKLCNISPSGDLSDVHTFIESHIGSYARFAAIYAVNGLCYGVNDHGGFFIYDRNVTLSLTSVQLADIIERRCLLSGLLDIGDLDTSEIAQSVRGYRVPAITSIRSTLEPLQGAWPFDVLPSGYKIKFKPRGSTPAAALTIDELGAASGNDKVSDILTQSREMDTQLPVKVQVVYIDFNREYDKGSGAGAWRSNTDAVNVSTINMPIVLNADEAAGIEETLLYLYWMERIEFRFTLPPTRWALEVCDVVTLTAPGASYELRLTEISNLTDGRMECAARLNNPAIYTPTAKGQEGQSTGQVLTYPGGSILALLDIPCVDSAYMNDLGLLTTVSGISSSWRGATLFRSSDSGITWQSMQDFYPPGAIIGTTTNVIDDHSRYVIDRYNILNVRLIKGSLTSVSETAMLNGANHFAYGAHGRWEIIAAQTCTQEIDGTWTLSGGLLRGRFGTEQYMDDHVIGDILVLLDTASLRVINLALSEVNVVRQWKHIDAGTVSDYSSPIEQAYAAINLKCLSPVDLNGNRHPTTWDWSLSCTPRSRIPIDVFSGMIQPFSESIESYDVEIYDASYSTLKRTFYDLSSPLCTYSSTQQFSDFGSIQSTVYLKWYQLSGSIGRGYPLIESITRPLYEIPRTTVSLLHFNGTSGSTTILDVFGANATVYGTAQLYSSGGNKFSENLYVAGSGDRISLPDGARFDFGNGGGTIRGWIRTGSANIVLWTKSSGSGYGPVSFQIVGGYLKLYCSTSGTAWDVELTGSYAINNGAWHFVEAGWKEGSFYLFNDGTLADSDFALGALVSNTNPVFMGANSDGSGSASAYFDDWQVTKGPAINTSSYIPPTSEFPDV